MSRISFARSSASKRADVSMTCSALCAKEATILVAVQKMRLVDMVVLTTEMSAPVVPVLGAPLQAARPSAGRDPLD